MSDPRTPSPNTLRMRGVVAVGVVVLAVAVSTAKPFERPSPTIDFTVVAPSIPDAVEVGTPVDMRDETVGTVCGIDTTAPEARLRLCLSSGNAFRELTEQSGVSVVSRNLFGDYAVRLAPSAVGAPLTPDATLTLADSPGDHSITGAVRSVGSFTLPVLTPRLSGLLSRAGDYAIRTAPFVAAMTEALRAMERAQTLPLRRVLPTLGDVADGGGRTVEEGWKSLRLLSKEEDLGNRPHTERVYAMVDSLGDMFGDTGRMLMAASEAEPALALVTSYTEPLRQSLDGVEPAELAALITRLGGAFHRDRASGATRLRIGVELGGVPSVATPLSILLSRGRR